MAKSNITKEVVMKIADLAKLQLTDHEIGQYSEQFSVIFEHFEKLSKVDTSGVKPLVTPSHITPLLRDDVVRPGLGGEKTVSNAPEKQGNLFKVPPVVG